MFFVHYGLYIEKFAIVKKQLDGSVKTYVDEDVKHWSDLISVLNEVFDAKKVPFIFIIDEWDCIFRVHKSDENSQTKYLNFLRNLLKDQSYVGLLPT